MKRRINPVVIVGVLIAVVALIGIITTLIMRRIPTRKQMDLTEYYGQTDDSEAVLIIGTQILKNGQSCLENSHTCLLMWWTAI